MSRKRKQRAVRHTAPRPRRGPDLGPHLQEQLEQLGDDLVKVSVGGGAVSVVMSGANRLQSVNIQPELLDPSEAEMLQDLIVAAVNQAAEQAQVRAFERLNRLVGPLGAAGLH